MDSTKPSNPKDLIGSTKIPVHLWPNTATYLGAMALLDGASKYGRANWRVIGVRASIYYDAARRHLDKWFEGHDFDTDDGTEAGPRTQGGSGLPHLAHALACLAILVDAHAAGHLNDDRQYPGGFASLVTELTQAVPVILARYAKLAPQPHHYTGADAPSVAEGPRLATRDGEHVSAGRVKIKRDEDGTLRRVPSRPTAVETLRRMVDEELREAEGGPVVPDESTCPSCQTPYVCRLFNKCAHNGLRPLI